MGESMSFEAKCPHCGMEYEAEDEWLGMEADCPGCETRITIEKASNKPALVIETPPPVDTVASAPAEELPPQEAAAPEPPPNQASSLKIKGRDCPDETPTEMKSCPNCEKPVAVDAIICIECGTNQQTGGTMNTKVSNGGGGKLNKKVIINTLGAIATCIVLVILVTVLIVPMFQENVPKTLDASSGEKDAKSVKQVLKKTARNPKVNIEELKTWEIPKNANLKSIKLSPQGKHLIYGDFFVDGKQVKPEEYMVLFNRVYFSPNGERYALMVSKRARLQNDDPLFAFVDGKLYSEDAVSNTDTKVIFSDDSKHFAYVAGDMVNKNYIVMDGKKVADVWFNTKLYFLAGNKILGHSTSDVILGKAVYQINKQSIKFSPDKKHVIFKYNKGRESFVVIDGKEHGPYLKIGRLMISKTGKAAFEVLDHNKNCFVFNGKKGPLCNLTKQASFSPAGNSFAYIGIDSSSRKHKYFLSLNNQKLDTPESLAKGEEKVREFLWFPNSDSLNSVIMLKGDINRARSYKNLSAEEKLRQTPGVFKRLCFSKDGKHLAFIKKVENGGEQVVVDGKPLDVFDRILFVSFGPTGHFAFVGQNETEGKKEVLVAIDGTYYGPYPKGVNIYFSPFGKVVYKVKENPMLFVDGKGVGDVGEFREILFSRDNQMILVRSNRGVSLLDGKKLLINLKSKIIEAEEQLTPDPFFTLYDNSKLDGNIYFLVNRKYKPQNEIDFSPLKFSPDGKHYVLKIKKNGEKDKYVFDGKILNEYKVVKDVGFVPGGTLAMGIKDKQCALLKITSEGLIENKKETDTSALIAKLETGKERQKVEENKGAKTEIQSKKVEVKKEANPEKITQKKRKLAPRYISMQGKWKLIRYYSKNKEIKKNEGKFKFVFEENRFKWFFEERLLDSGTFVVEKATKKGLFKMDLISQKTKGKRTKYRCTFTNGMLYLCMDKKGRRPDFFESKNQQIFTVYIKESN
jgi:uncharacterized protein (TIGR03067 family)